MTGRNDPCPCGSGKKFKKCCLGKEKSLAAGGSATAASAELRKALEEVQAFVDQHMQQQNRRPMDDFHGLSPEQMYQMLNLPFASPELVRFPEVLDTAPSAPLLLAVAFPVL